MKILFLNTNIGYGGASKMIVWVANQFADRGDEVTLLTYRDMVIRQPINPRVKLVQVSLEEGVERGNVILTSRWIHKYIRDNKFEVGVSFLSPSILRMAIASKGTKMKVVFSHRGDPFFRGNNRSVLTEFVGFLNNWAFRQADGYVFQTEMACKYYGKRIQNHSIVIPNPITPLFRTEAREGNVRKSFVTVGRLDLRQKRQNILIEAFNIISNCHPEFYLEIYGDGEDEAKIKQMASSNPQILMMGKTDRVNEVMQNAYATVLSSEFEGIPNALLESMSLGVPSISTDCTPGGAAMLITDKVNGLLTPRGDAAALAAAMEYMITHPNEAESMGKEGMKVNEIFTEDKIRQQWLTFIDKLYAEV